MSVEQLKQLIPDYAKDLRLNLSSLVSTPPATLSEQQFWGTMLACAVAARNAATMQALAAEAAQRLSEPALQAAKAAAALMGMNNIYYRFVHMAGNKEYGQMPARLRMNVMANPGVEKKDFELWSLAVSAINGCGMCINAHEAGLLKEGVDKAAIQDAVRIAAIVHAVAAVLDAEAAMEGAGAA